MKKRLALIGTVLAAAVFGHELTLSGTHFQWDGAPFPYTGLSFFNALYNPEFNRSDEVRTHWLRKFKAYGINVLRVWAQWDNKRGFVDSCAECSLYTADGTLRTQSLERLKQLATAADAEGMAVEFVLFSQESWQDGIRLAPDAADRAVAAVARELLPYRDVTLQIWNEFSDRVAVHVRTIRRIDGKRLVTNSPGGAGVLGDAEQNRLLDYLAPHTSRQRSGAPWTIAPAEIRYLLELYRKPVVDDEPARNGTAQFGGPGERTSPYDHILHMWEVWKAGGYVTYHHDMFQLGGDAKSVPPLGIPDPEFSPYHRVVFEFLRERTRYAPSLSGMGVR